MKKLMNLKGSKELNKNEQKSILGGGGGNGGYNCPGPVLFGEGCCEAGGDPVYCQGTIIAYRPCE